jgi:hypothetical protein
VAPATTTAEGWTSSPAAQTRIAKPPVRLHRGLRLSLTGFDVASMDSPGRPPVDRVVEHGSVGSQGGHGW